MIRRLLRLTLGYLAWVVITLLLGCSGPTFPWQHRPRLVIVWLDRSASARELRPQFGRWAAALLADTTLRAGDRVVIAPIDGASYGLRNATDITLPRLRPLGETAEAHERAMQDARQRIRSAVDSILAMPSAGATAILQALAVSGQLIAADAGREAHVIVMSDGIEDRAGFRLTPANATRVRGARAAEQLMNDGEPFRPGVCVSFAGVGALPGHDAAWIGAYWRAVVTGMGGRVGRIGPTLMGGLAACGPVGHGPM
jgi:hypothetical protein